MAIRETRKRNLYFAIILVLITLIDLVLILNAGKQKYTVVFIDGDMVSPFVVKENSKVQELENKKEDFIGWYLDDKKYDFDNVVSENIVLKAKYEEKIMHKVTFDTDGGSVVSPVMVKDSKALVEPSNPVKENYRFVGWLLGENLYDFNLPVTGELTLKALWEEVPEGERIYTISFDTDGGSSIEPLKVRASEYASKPENPTKEGYTFNGWYLNQKPFSWNFKITSSLELKAKWTARKKLKITFDAKGGDAILPINVYQGDTTELPLPVKPGYVFEGWYYGRIRYTDLTKITASVKLTAKWVTADEANLANAIQSIKSSYEILKGGTKIKATYVGCVINNTNAEVLDTITRDLSDKSVTLKFSVQCGAVKKSTTSKAIIKASTYTYKTENLKLTLNGTNYDGEIFKLNGTKIANVLSGVATLNEDLNENIILIFHDDAKTKYVLKKIGN